jgi:hypothetical protein
VHRRCYRCKVYTESWHFIVTQSTTITWVFTEKEQRVNNSHTCIHLNMSEGTTVVDLVPFLSGYPSEHVDCWVCTCCKY